MSITSVRFVILFVAGVVLGSGNALAQTAPAPAASANVKAWSFSASESTYLLPDEGNYGQPTFAADRGWLHLEGRYNYEGLRTGSAWIGRNWSFGKNVTLDITPMIGAVFGDTSGVAPGYEASLGWRMLEFSSETEYVFDGSSAEDRFLYTWSEFSVAPRDWFRFGLAVQRTKAYQTEFDIQRGFLIGASYKSVSFTTYVFNPDARHPTVVLGVEVAF